MNTDNAHPVTIVMIEDDDGHARLIERNIRRAGVTNEIVPLTNGHAALEFLLGEDGSGTVNSRRALLVLLDLNLPDMSGVDILQKIKTNTHLKRTPVVVLTTTDDEREIQRCYDLASRWTMLRVDKRAAPSFRKTITTPSRSTTT